MTSEEWGMKANWQKTRVMRIGREHEVHNIKVDDKSVEQVTEVKYLGKRWRILEHRKQIVHCLWLFRERGPSSIVQNRTFCFVELKKALLGSK